MKKIEAYPVGIYMLKVNNRNTRTTCEICSKLTIKIPERLQWRFTPCSSVSIANYYIERKTFHVKKASRLTVYPEDFLRLHQISFIEAEY